MPADPYDRVPYSVLERGMLPRRRVSLQRLEVAVEEHWLARGRDVSLGGGYYLQAVGWEEGDTHRIVFRASRRLTRLGTSGSGTDSADPFLGYWSIAMTGLDPRLLAETPNGFALIRFGKYLGLVFQSRPSRSGFDTSGGPAGTR